MGTEVDQNENINQAANFLGVYLADERSEEKQNPKESAAVNQIIKCFWSKYGLFG